MQLYLTSIVLIRYTMTNIAKTLILLLAICSTGCIELHQSDPAYAAYSEEIIAISMLEQDPAVLLSGVGFSEADLNFENRQELEVFKHDTMLKDSVKLNPDKDLNNRDTLMSRIINAYVVSLSE